MRALAAVMLLTACGRVGFDPLVEVDGLCRAQIATQTLVADGTANGVALANGPSTLAVGYHDPSRDRVVVLDVNRDGSIARTLTRPGLTQTDETWGAPQVAWLGSEIAMLRSMVPELMVGDIVFTQFAADGSPRESAISPDGSFRGSVDLATNDVGFGATWVGNFPEPGAWFAPLDGSGARATMGDGLIGGDCLCEPRVVWNGTSWSEVIANDGVPGQVGFGYRIALGLFAADGTAVSPALLISEPDQPCGSPEIAWNGTHHGIGWIRGSITTEIDVQVARVDAAGRRETSLTIWSVPVGSYVRFDLTNIGGEFFATISDATGLWLWPLGPVLEPAVDPTFLGAVTNITNVELVGDADGMRIGWTAAGNLYLTRVDCEAPL